MNDLGIFIIWLLGVATGSMLGYVVGHAIAIRRGASSQDR